MELTQILGNTWAIHADELIPLYKLDDHRCILLDSGLPNEQEKLDETLRENGLLPVGILCSHAHVDHCANNAYLQKKYHAKVALTAPEAGMCSSVLSLKCYFLTLTAQEVEEMSSVMLHTPDVLVPSEDGLFTFQGVDFRIIHTPGHSPGHICVITPDDVCYTGDALLSREFLNAKLPYNLCHRAARDSREKLRGMRCAAFVMPHRGVCPPEELDRLIDANNDLLEKRAGEMLALVKQPMTASEINAAACKFYELFTKKTSKGLYLERNIRFMVEYLVETERLVTFCQGGVVYYQQAQ